MHCFFSLFKISILLIADSLYDVWIFIIVQVLQMSLPSFSNQEQASQQIDSYHEKININLRDQDTYKRSTNNSHKKFIGIARKLLLKNCNSLQKEGFTRQFQSLKNSRVYFFIILAHIKYRRDSQRIQSFKSSFSQLINNKIQDYQQQIINSKSFNFTNFRLQEIADLQLAQRSFELYFSNRKIEAIKTLYKKIANLTHKKQYETAVQIVEQVQKKLQSYENGQLFPYIYLDEANTKNRNNKKMSQPLPQHKQIIKQNKAEEQENIENSSTSQIQSSQYSISNDKQHTKRKKNKRSQIRKYQQKMEKHLMNSILSKPLLFLENSYPIFNCFFPVLYSMQQTEQNKMSFQQSQVPAFLRKKNNYPFTNLINKNEYKLNNQVLHLQTINYHNSNHSPSPDDNIIIEDISSSTNRKKAEASNNFKKQNIKDSPCKYILEPLKKTHDDEEYQSSELQI